MSESLVKVLAAFIDTLVLNIYPTDGNFCVVNRRLDTDLREELERYKEQAQEEEEAIPTRFVFGSNLLMKPKGGDGFNWILANTSLSLAVNRSAKMNMLAQVRCSSEYLWSERDLGKILSDVYCFLTTVFGQHITMQLSACDLAADVVNFHPGSIQDVKEHFVTRAQLDDQLPLDMLSPDGMSMVPIASNDAGGASLACLSVRVLASSPLCSTIKPMRLSTNRRKKSGFMTSGTRKRMRTVLLCGMVPLRSGGSKCVLSVRLSMRVM